MTSDPHRIIPGGAHTYSKGDDQFPSNAPRFLERGEGAHVWDDHDRRFLDWTMGLRTMTLGYGAQAVNAAAIAQIARGANFGRPSRLEMDAAGDLLDLIPAGDMVKFAKNGSSATTAAVKLARAHTGRDLVALCSDHPFFSYDDWAIAVTRCDNGIPRAVKDLTLTFRYNDLAGVERLFEAHPGGIAALIMEAATTDEPRDGFLHGVEALCRAHGAVFILDEMITGFRWHLNGAQTLFGVTPDISTFGKGIANGFSVAAMVGKRAIMELGGIEHDQKRTFLLSTTHGAENHALAAMRAALRIYRDEPVVAHLWRIGGLLIDGLNQAAGEAGVGMAFRAGGFPCSPVVTCMDRDGLVSAPFRTLWLQEMVRRGVLANYFAPSYAHTATEVEITVAAARESLRVYARALQDGIDGFLEGPPVKPVFRPYN
ncbi:MAG: glutamate-1-semialdehyde 2,1-aminomutase [Alphaproteobacteria bacterium]|nr:glutamate-1-semialdehyde 2,1-aminomutase [Alphaproteobacteria bacterium]